MSQRRVPTILRLSAALLAALLLAGACSSDEESDDGDATTTAPGGDGEESAGPDVPEECEDPALAAVEERGEPEASVTEQVTGDGPVDIVEGDGEAVGAEGSVTIHYTIFNPANDEVIESSWESGPQDIPLAQVFPAFTESMSGMKVGGRRAFSVPATEVAGDPPPPESGLSADDTVVFVIDLVRVSATGGSPVAADPDALAAAESRGAPEMSVPEGEAETEELVVIDDVEGEGDIVCPGDTVLAHYTGIQASDGEQFDSSWERGEPAEFGLDAVIQGWSEGLVGMKVGGRRTLVIPADQAYGEEAAEGRPGGVLVFTVDMVGVG